MTTSADKQTICWLAWALAVISRVKIVRQNLTCPYTVKENPARLDKGDSIVLLKRLVIAFQHLQIIFIFCVRYPNVALLVTHCRN